jgi:hypothetical protein
MKLKKRQNIERAALAAAAAAGGREDDNNEDPFSAPSPLRSRATKGESGHAGGSRSGFSGSAGQSNPFLVVLKNIQSEEHQEEAPQQEQEQVQQGHQQNKDDEEMFEALPVKATAPAAASIASTLASSCHSRSQPAPLPAVSTLVGDTSTASTSSKSIELRNRAVSLCCFPTTLVDRKFLHCGLTTCIVYRFFFMNVDDQRTYGIGAVKEQHWT